MTHLRLRWLPFAVFLTGAFVASGMGVAPAWAQPSGLIVVVPNSTHELTDAEQRAADLVESGLMAQRARVVSMHDARDRMQSQSRPPASPDNSDLDVLASEAHAALEHVAFGRSAAAQRSVQEVLSRAERALESLNRETKTARNVLDACLALVRNALARDQRRDALAEAMRCRRLVPDVSPSEMLHPASVIGVLAEADDSLRRMRIGRLTVESVPEIGCAAYVNGRHLGVTPFRLDRAAAGEYRVQVECSRTPGRVHIVQLGDDVVDLLVDAEFDRALRSGDRLALIYPDDKSRARLSARHGAQVAKTVKADEAVLVSVEGANAVLVRVNTSQKRVLGRTRFAWLEASPVDGSASPVLTNALDLLFQGHVASELAPGAPMLVAGTAGKTTGPKPQPRARLASEPPAEASSQVSEEDVAAAAEAEPEAEAGAEPEAWPARPPRQPMSRTRRLRIAAGGLAAAGAGLLATGIAFEMKRERADNRLAAIDANDPANTLLVQNAQNIYEAGANLRWLGLGGSALLTAAVPLMRIDLSAGVPWWSYTLGAAGGAFAAWGSFEIVKGGKCELFRTDGSCIQPHEGRGRGMLLIAAAAPLLAFPISHVIEKKFAKRERAARAYLAPSPTSVMLVVQKEIDSW